MAERSLAISRVTSAADSTAYVGIEATTVSSRRGRPIAIPGKRQRVGNVWRAAGLTWTDRLSKFAEVALDQGSDRVDHRFGRPAVEIENRTESPWRICSRVTSTRLLARTGPRFAVRFSMNTSPGNLDRVLIRVAAGRRCKPCVFWIVTSRISFDCRMSRFLDGFCPEKLLLNLILFWQQALQRSLRYLIERGSQAALGLRRRFLLQQEAQR